MSDETLAVAAEHLWHNIDSGLWWNHKPLADWLAGFAAAQRAEALREAADAVRDVRTNGLPDGADYGPTSEGFEDWLRARAEADQ